MPQDDIIKALDLYFSQDKKFVDVSRIPLICQDIRGIHQTQKDIKEMLQNEFVSKESFWPIKTLVYGAVSIMLTALFSAIVYLVLK